MTVVRRRVSQPVRRARRAPLDQRFPRGLLVAVVEDYHDARYAEKKGEVIKVVTEPDDTYPGGRVGVRLVYDELVHKLFGGKAPQIVWFKSRDLEKQDVDSR